MQNGQILHIMDNETRLKPKRYIRDAGPASTDKAEQEKPDVMNMLESEIAVLDVSRGSGSNPFTAYLPSRRDSPEFAQYSPVSAHPQHARSEFDAGTGYASSEGLRMGGNQSLSRFKPLTLNGVSMTAATIGGYQLDLEATTRRAREYVPLPPVCLPLIFNDDDLNFSHHFFQGMEILLGRSFITRVTEARRYSENDGQEILPALKALILAGHRETDTELQTFVKRVLSSTFSTVPAAHLTDNPDCLIVASNFYGFQYIEARMRCGEQDLGMWLSVAYSQYRTAWFNAFKSSGVPAFAQEGVQDRYEARQERPPAYTQGGEGSLTEVVRRHESHNAHDEDRARQQRRERRANRERREDPKRSTAWPFGGGRS